MTTYHWTSSATGNWGIPGNWGSPSAFPNGAADIATIDASGTYTVNITASDSFAVQSITLNDATATLAIAGLLTVGQGVSVQAGSLVINGGTLKSSTGTLTATSGAITLGGVNGIVAGLKIDAALTIAAGATIGLTGGAGVFTTGGASPGSITVNAASGAYGTLLLRGTQTLASSVTFNQAFAVGTTLDVGDQGGLADTLTIAAGVTLQGAMQLYDGSSGLGGAFVGGTATVDNKGVILASNVSAPDNAYVSAFINDGGITISPSSGFAFTGGNFTNTATGTINVGASAELLLGAASSFVNAGVITGSGGFQIGLNTGTFDNSAGTITTTGTGSSLVGLTIAGQLASDAAFGTINRTGNAIIFEGQLNHTGSTIDTTSGTFAGLVSAAADIVGGTIIENATTGLTFRGFDSQTTLDNVTLVGPLRIATGGQVLLQNGAHVLASLGGPAGTITVGSTASSAGVLEIGANTSPGTISFTGSLAAYLKIDDPVHFTSTIAALTKPDVLDFTSVTYVSGATATYDSVTQKLTVVSGSTSLSVSLSGIAAGTTFTASSSALVYPTALPGTVVQIACFEAGTRILTARGQVAVEHLKVGDRVPSHPPGELRTVRWIGRREIVCRDHAAPDDVWPIRIRPDALARNVPQTDVWLSPEHAVLIDDALVPVRHLVTGSTIAQERRETVVYYHVELDRHAVLLAGGLPCESYLDSGGRASFETVGRATPLPDGIANPCARIVEGGAELASIRAGLLRRAASLALQRQDAEAPTEPCLSADGILLRPAPDAAGRQRFLVPSGTRWLRLVSPASRTGRDRRMLGVAATEIVIGNVPVPLSRLDASDGWHSTETEGKREWRWTNGDAALPWPPAVRSGGEIEVTVRIVAEAVQPPVRSTAPVQSIAA